MALSLTKPQERGFATTQACQMGSILMQAEQGKKLLCGVLWQKRNVHSGRATAETPEPYKHVDELKTIRFVVHSISVMMTQV